MLLPDNKNENLPAFPHTHVDDGNPAITFMGLTKREEFARSAMYSTGHMISNAPYVTEAEANEIYKNWAKTCVRMADAILKELEL